MLPMMTFAANFLLLVILTALFMAVIPSVVRMSRRSSAVKRHAEELMKDRPPLSSSEFGCAYFPPKHQKVAPRIRDILGRVLIVDVNRVGADDRLIEDLGLGVVNGMDADFVELDIDRELHVDIGSAWPVMKTVRDMVTFVGNHCPKQGP